MQIAVRHSLQLYDPDDRVGSEVITFALPTIRSMAMGGKTTLEDDAGYDTTRDKPAFGLEPSTRR